MWDWAAVGLKLERTKNLSVNNDSLPPANQGCGELEQSHVAGFGLFEADQKFAVSIEP
jgi:hypothetical protein